MTGRMLDAAAIAGVGLLLGGCGILASPSPTTTYRAEDGTEVTVDWQDYPGHAGMDSAAILAAPDQDALETGTRALMSALKDAIEEGTGFTMSAPDGASDWFADASWFPSVGNGYGGDTMLTTINCCDLIADRAPRPEEWPAVLAAASRVTSEFGLGELVLEQDSEAMAGDPAWAKEYADDFCNGPGGQCWSWSATAMRGAQWVFFAIQDVAYDPTGGAARDAEKYDSPPAQISVSFGATVIRSGMRDAFESAIRPFEGLEKPAASASD